VKDKISAQNSSEAELLEQLSNARKQAAESFIINRSMISSIGDGLIVVNEYGLITEVNETALDLLQYRKNELLGKWFPRALPIRDKDGKELPATERPVLISLISGLPVTAVHIYIKKDGTPFHVYATTAPYLIEGKPKGAIIIFRDFSNEIKVEQAKDEFVSLASHQLRTPLTSILLYIGLIKYEEDSLSEEVRSFLKKIEISANNMQQLIGDFLDISKLELGKLEVNSIPINLTELIDAQISELLTFSNESKVKIIFNKPPGSTLINTDPGLLTQAIHNLISNSIRYRNPKNPQIQINIKNTSSDFIVCVKDNGIGIPLEAQPKIFQRLYRADNAIETEDGGTGLGLYLVKKVVALLGGEVWFKSKENIGTSFFIKLPRDS
jgi:PAS domain S-box-containing protein